MENKLTKRFGKLSEGYFNKFGDSFPTFSVGNDIKMACEEMEKAIKDNKQFVPHDPPEMIL